MSHLIAGHSEGISGSIVALSDFFDCSINFLSLSLVPNVRCGFQARFLDGGTHELMQQDATHSFQLNPPANFLNSCDFSWPQQTHPALCLRISKNFFNLLMQRMKAHPHQMVSPLKVSNFLQFN